MPEFDLDAALQPPPVRYRVEGNGFGGWDDAGWAESDEGTDEMHPMTFASVEEANAEIADHCEMAWEAWRRGDMDDPDRLEDFRVVEVPRA